MRKCEKCDQGFEKESNFRFHKDVLHKDVLTSSYFGGVEDIETKFRCEICETKFKTEGDLNKHKMAVWCNECSTFWNCKYHNQRSKCTTCDENLSCKMKFEVHWYHKHAPILPRVILWDSNDVAEETKIQGTVGGISGLRQKNNSVKLTSLEDLFSPDDEFTIREAWRTVREEKEVRELREEDEDVYVFESEVDDIIHSIREAAQTNQIGDSITNHIKNACYSALKGMDQAFIAGILRTVTGEERDDSKNYAKNKSYRMKLKAAAKAKAYFEEARREIKFIKEEEYEKLRFLKTSDFLSIRNLFDHITAVSINTIKNAKTALQNSENLEAEGEEIRCDMQEDVRNAEANDDFKEKLMWIKSKAKREGWSATLYFEAFKIKKASVEKPEVSTPMEKRNSRKFECIKCGNDFDKESNFNFHKDALHKSKYFYFCEVGDTEFKFRCETCELKF